MNKKLIIIVISLLTLLSLFTGCKSNESKQAELSEKDIQKILSEVTGGEQALFEAGKKYFSELNSENRNLIEPDSLNKLISSNNDKIYILDIRKESDFAESHINGANNIWWFDVGKNIEKLPKDKKIIVCCYTGQSAGQVVGVLRMMGFDATSLVGGFNNGWLKNKMPVVH